MSVGLLHRIPFWFKALKDDAIVLYYAWKHPHTPVFIKALTVAVLAYVFSPVDVIPDYLPLLGIADDAILLPAAIHYLTHLLPASVQAECAGQSRRWRSRLPWLLVAVGVALLLWLTVCLLGIVYLIVK